MNAAELEKMSNLVAEVFRVELSDSLKASILPFVSFLKWTNKAGPEQDHLKRAAFAWYKRAQMPARLIKDKDHAESFVLEEIEPMLSERVEEWTKALREEGKAEGLAKGKAEGLAKGKAEGLAKGKAEGLAEGKAAERRMVAARLLTSGMDAAEVAEVTGLSVSEVLTLRETLPE